MPIKDNFSPEEWASVTNAPMLVSLAVSASDPGGPIAMMKESTAFAHELVGAVKEGTGLVGEVADHLKADRPGREELGVKDLKTPDALEQHSIDAIREAASIVAAKAPDESAAYNAFLMDIANRVANSAKEGSTLGFGGTKVSEGEAKALADIAAALGVSR